MVTTAVADLVESACEIATTLTLGGLGSLAGAVYTPAAVIVPTVALPPVVLLTCQVTAVSVVFVTVAVNVWAALGASVTEAGEMLIATAGGGGGGVDPPPQPASGNAAITAIRYR